MAALRKQQPAAAAGARAARTPQSRQLRHQSRRRCANGSRAKRKRSAATCCRASPRPTCSTTASVSPASSTGDMGVARDGSHKPGYQPGYELRAKYTVFAEGCRGHLGRRLEARFDLRARRRSAALRDRLQGDLADRPREASRRARSCTRSAGRSTRRPTAAGSSITPRTRACTSGSSSGSAIATRTSIRSRSSNVGSSTRESASCSPAASGSRTARAPSTKADCSRCRSCRFLAACSWAARPAS